MSNCDCCFVGLDPLRDSNNVLIKVDLRISLPCSKLTLLLGYLQLSFRNLSDFLHPPSDLESQLFGQPMPFHHFLDGCILGLLLRTSLGLVNGILNQGNGLDRSVILWIFNSSLRSECDRLVNFLFGTFSNKIGLRFLVRPICQRNIKRRCRFCFFNWSELSLASPILLNNFFESVYVSLIVLFLENLERDWCCNVS